MLVEANKIMGKVKHPSFEENYKRLEEIIARLDSGNLPLDESVALYKEGMLLAQYCEQQLDNAEIEVTRIQVDVDKINPSAES
jgi:exodeoxyribonuclease VII small subunit